MLRQVTYKTTPFQNTCCIPLVSKEWHTGHNGACPNAVTHGLNHSVIWEQTGPSTTTSKAVLGFMLPQVTYKTMPFQNTCCIPLVSKEWHFLVTTVPVQLQSHMG